MSYIMQKRSALYNPGPVPLYAQKRSLNRDIRRKELVKITVENQAIL